MTKEQLQKLYNLELITLVTGEDVLLDEIKDMSDDEALTHLKNLEIFNHIIDNGEILNLLSDDANAVAEVDEDDVVNPTTKEDEDDVVNPTTKEDEDDVVNPTTKEDEDDSPIVDDGE